MQFDTTALTLPEANALTLWGINLSDCVNLFNELTSLPFLDSSITEKIKTEKKRFKETLSKLLVFATYFAEEADHVHGFLVGPKPLVEAQRELQRLVPHCEEMKTQSLDMIKCFDEVKDGLRDLEKKLEEFLAKTSMNIKKTELKSMNLKHKQTKETSLEVLEICDTMSFYVPFWRGTSALFNNVVQSLQDFQREAAVSPRGQILVHIDVGNLQRMLRKWERLSANMRVVKEGAELNYSLLDRIGGDR